MWRMAAGLLIVLCVGCGGSSSPPPSTDDAAAAPETQRTVTASADTQVRIVRAAWRNVPSVTVVSARADDPRVSQVRDAVAFWNQTLEEIGSAFRLGAVRHVAKRTPDSVLIRLSQIAATPGAPNTGGFSLSAAEHAQIIQGLDNPELVVMLSDGAFISFSSGVIAIDGRTQSLVALQASNIVLARPNVMANVIAHELGHSLGLIHNADPTQLMCGRPAECRPDAFASQEPRWFPLTEAEKARLLLLYPAAWKPLP